MRIPILLLCVLVLIAAIALMIWGLQPKAAAPTVEEQETKAVPAELDPALKKMVEEFYIGLNSFNQAAYGLAADGTETKARAQLFGSMYTAGEVRNLMLLIVRTDVYLEEKRLTDAEKKATAERWQRLATYMKKIRTLPADEPIGFDSSHLSMEEQKDLQLQFIAVLDAYKAHDLSGLVPDKEQKFFQFIVENMIE